MERFKGKFAEVAEKSKAKRAKLDEETAAREAKKAKDDEADAERSLKFASELKHLQRNSGSFNLPDAISDGLEESNREFAQNEPAVVNRGDVNLEEYEQAEEADVLAPDEPKSGDAEELNEFRESIRRMLLRSFESSFPN